MRIAINRDDIEFPEAYERAVRSKIIGGAQKKFLAAYDRADEVYNFLRGYQDEAKESFLKSMAVNLFENYGKLSEKQYLAVCNIIDTFAEKRNAYIAAVEAQKAKSEYLGVADEKVSLRLKVDSVISINAQKFSYYDSSVQYIFLMSDLEGNRVVYKSKNYLSYKFPKSQMAESLVFYGDALSIQAGMVIEVNASIKAQVEYKGEKQTIIQRPKVVAVEYAEADLKDVLDRTN
jgi:hypothetical protein